MGFYVTRRQKGKAREGGQPGFLTAHFACATLLCWSNPMLEQQTSSGDAQVRLQGPIFRVIAFTGAATGGAETGRYLPYALFSI